MKTYTPVMEAMLREIELRKNILTSKKLSSVYFGGGTPSLLAEKDLFAFVEKIHSTFEVEASAEITLEANPDDLTIERLGIFQAAGINRLSIGTQSFFDDELKLMNRVHNAQEAESAIKRAQDAGFENITIDLMYGMPGNSNHRWQQNLAKAISLQVPHISAYALTVEPKTALAKMVKNGEVVLPNEDTIAQQYHHLCREMAVGGFNHYELSNFGKPGFYSAHNTAYWNGTPYLGIGPGAHSFVEHMRQANVANNSIYLQKVSAGEPWWETEEVDEKDRLNEYLMTGLRTARGVSITTIKNNFGTFAADKVLREAANYLECGRLQLNDDNLIIPEKDWLISDRIISDLFWV